MSTQVVTRDSRAFAIEPTLVATAESPIVTFVRPREALALGLATLALTARPVHAQPAAADGSGNKEQAARLASEAEGLGKKQQFADALSKYKEAAKLDPATAAYQCNIGMAYYALGDEARAYLYFGRCKRANNGSWPSSNVEDVFNYLVGVLGKKDYTPLNISGNPGDAEVLINLYAEEGPLVAPVTVYVPFSNYQIQVRADGHETKLIPVEANNRTEKSVTYDLKEAASTGDGGAMPAGNGGGAGNLTSGGDVDQQVDTGGGRKKWPLVLAGGGVVAGIGGYFAYRAARSKQDELCSAAITGSDSCSPNVLPGQQQTADRLEKEMRTREIVAYSLWGIGAAAIGAGLVLYFTQPENDGSTSVAVSAAPTSGGGMVVLSLTH